MKPAKEAQFKSRLTFPVNQLINSEFRKHGKREVVKTKWQPTIGIETYIEDILGSELIINYCYPNQHY